MPWLIKKFYPECVWAVNTSDKNIYLTFDDGPHPVVTKFVLDELQKYNAKATFFCIGKNVQAHPDVYKRILNEGHGVGNHTQEHLNGWETPDDAYISNVEAAGNFIRSNLFRPPYGRITRSQIKKLRSDPFRFNIIMWSILSGDFDKTLSPEKCYSNVKKNATPGSIIVFHDSEKAFEKIRYSLPLVLETLTGEGYQFKVVSP